MRLTGFVCTNTWNHQKTLWEIFEKAKNKKLLKIKWILKCEIQANWWAHFLRLACQGAARTPALPVSYATDYMKVEIPICQTKLHHYENVSVNHLKFK